MTARGKELSLGNSGPEVEQLQKQLNRLPSIYPTLTSIGYFDLPTMNRVKDFQRQNHVYPDGIVDARTRGAIMNMLARQSEKAAHDSVFSSTPWHRADEVQVAPAVTGRTTAQAIEDAMRDKIIATAEAEAKEHAWTKGVDNDKAVAAKLSGGKDANGRTMRMGWEQLQAYFHVSAPTLVTNDTIKYFGRHTEKDTTGQDHMVEDVGKLEPLPHWCGIFALWAYKTAGADVGLWVTGSGISSVKGFHPINIKSASDVKRVRKGDVGYVDQPFQHHFILKEVHEDGSLATIEGNSEPHSNFNIKPNSDYPGRSLKTIDAVYTIF